MDIIFYFAEVRRAGRSNLPSELLYYSGTCGDDATNEEIAENFIIIIGNSPYNDICDDVQECSVQNVEVICGPTILSTSPSGIRSRRDKWHQGKRVKDTISRGIKETPSANIQQQFEYSISWEFAVNVDQDPSLSNFDAALNAEDFMIQMVDAIQAEIDNGAFPPPSVPGVNLELQNDSLAYGYIQVECLSGYISDNSDLHCCE